VSAGLAARRRARGPTPDVESSKERIHAATLRLLSRYGYEGMSLQMIADEVGLHKSSLFHHYRGKLELATEVFVTATGTLLHRIEPLAHDAPPRRETFFAVVDDCLDYLAEAPDVARLLLTRLVAPEDSDLNVPVGGADAGHPVQRLFRIVGSWLERARAAGVLRRQSIRQTIPNLIGVLLMQPSLVAGIADMTGADPADGPRERALRHGAVHALLEGLFEPGPPLPTDRASP